MDCNLLICIYQVNMFLKISGDNSRSLLMVPGLSVIILFNPTSSHGTPVFRGNTGCQAMSLTKWLANFLERARISGP